MVTMILNPTESEVHAVPNCAGRPFNKNSLALEITEAIPKAICRRVKQWPPVHLWEVHLWEEAYSHVDAMKIIAGPMQIRMDPVIV